MFQGFSLTDLGESMTGKEDKYRQYAEEAQALAEKAISERDKASWLKIAQSWLRLLPQRTPTAEERFEVDVRERGTGQDTSDASN
jgi:hypothetical protein